MRLLIYIIISFPISRTAIQEELCVGLVVIIRSLFSGSLNTWLRSTENRTGRADHVTCDVITRDVMTS